MCLPLLSPLHSDLLLVPREHCCKWSISNPADLFILIGIFAQELDIADNSRFSLWEVYAMQLLASLTAPFPTPAVTHPAELRRGWMSGYTRRHVFGHLYQTAFQDRRLWFRDCPVSILSTAFFPARRSKLCTVFGTLGWVENLETGSWNWARELGQCSVQAGWTHVDFFLSCMGPLAPSGFQEEWQSWDENPGFSTTGLCSCHMTTLIHWD